LCVCYIISVNLPFDFPEKIITLSKEGWTILIIAILFSLFRNIVYLYQYIIQNKLRNSNIVFLYSPFLFTIYNFFVRKNKRIILKTIKDVRPEPLRKEQLEEMINIFFRVEKEELKDWEIIDNNQHILFFYFKIIELKQIRKIGVKQTIQKKEDNGTRKSNFNTK